MVFSRLQKQKPSATQMLINYFLSSEFCSNKIQPPPAREQCRRRRRPAVAAAVTAAGGRDGGLLRRGGARRAPAIRRYVSTSRTLAVGFRPAHDSGPEEKLALAGTITTSPSTARWKAGSSGRR